MTRAAKERICERLYWTLFAMAGMTVHDATHHGWDAGSALFAFVALSAVLILAADHWRRA